MKSIYAIIICLLILVSCSYENEEELYPIVDCETEDMSYKKTIFPILINNGCLASTCHGDGDDRLDNTVDMEGYIDLKKYIDSLSTEFTRSIIQDPDSSFISKMPKDREKMNPCVINKILAWINDGAPNN